MFSQEIYHKKNLLGEYLICDVFLSFSGVWDGLLLDHICDRSDPVFSSSQRSDLLHGKVEAR